MMKLTTYDKYKDSGVEWLGDVPKHWEVSRLKNIIDFISEKYIGEKFFRKIGLENIESESGKFLDIKNDFDGDGIFFQNNDILFGKLRPNLAKVYLSDFEGIAVGDFFVFRSKKVLFPKMLKYILLKSSTIEQTVSSTYGAKMPRVSWQFMSNMHFGFPPLPEQNQIANYLDQSTTKIDKKIDLLTQKIKHYQDLKTALINRAVTKGLDDSVEMKDSGVEWIGEIPKHWEVKRLKSSFYIRKDTVGENSDDYTLLSLTQNGVIERDMENLQGKFPASFDTYQIVEKDDLIFCLFDMDVTPRTVGHSIFNGMITGAYTVLKTYENLVKEYFYWLFLSADEGKKLRRNYTGLRSTIKKDTFLSMSVSFPPKEEQQKIVEYLNQKTSTIDKIIATITTQIEHQKELRKTLINDVVTGKVKVENS